MNTKPTESVFISDLHLNPQEPQITQKFEAFVHWASNNAQSLYILGDFFHVWPGDDGLCEWSSNIANQLAWLVDQNVAVYFMHGNRDFLIGKRFSSLARLKLITEPTVINLGSERVLLLHGDSLCSDDKSHQFLRRLTRNPMFSTLFLKLPFKIRNALVNSVREHSQHNRKKSVYKLQIVQKTLLKAFHKAKATTIIHGHIHQPGIHLHNDRGYKFRQIVLSDWDDKPYILCYDRTKGFHFNLM